MEHFNNQPSSWPEPDASLTHESHALSACDESLFDDLQLRVSSTDLGNLSNQNNKLKMFTKQQMQRVEALEGSVIEKDAEIRQLQECVDCKDDEIRQLKDCVEERDACIADMQVQMDEKDRLIAQMQAQMQEMQARLDAAPKNNAQKAKTDTDAHPFYNIVQCSEGKDVQEIIEILHKRLDNIGGKDAAMILFAAIYKYRILIRKPSESEYRSEFILIGDWSSVARYFYPSCPQQIKENDYEQIVLWDDSPLPVS